MNEKTPVISVGMPVYNAEPWLQSSIESVLSQSYRNFELIISDNASTDATETICRQHAAGDSRIRYYRNKTNVGACENYSALFRYSKGKYFKWAASNDFCAPEFLQRCVEVLERRNDAVLCYPRTRLFIEDISASEDYVDDLDLQHSDPCVRFKQFLEGVRLLNVLNGLIRADVLKRTPLIKTYLSSDINLVAELALYGKFVELPDYMFYRRMDPKAATKFRSQKEVLRHHHPDITSVMYFQLWRQTYEYFASVWRAPLFRKQKAWLWGYLLRRAYWSGPSLIKEVRDALREPKPLLRPWDGSAQEGVVTMGGNDEIRRI